MIELLYLFNTVVGFLKKVFTPANHLRIDLIALVAIFCFVIFNSLTEKQPLNLIKKMRIQKDKPVSEITDDHPNVVDKFWTISNEMTLALVEQYPYLEITDIFINEMPSSVWLSSEKATEFFKTFLSDKVKAKKITQREADMKFDNTTLRKLQHQTMIKIAKYKAYNFFKEEPTYKNFYKELLHLKDKLTLIKFVPYDYGIYRIVYNPKTKKYFFFIEKGSIQIQNYYKKQDLQTHIIYPDKEYSKKDILLIDDGKFYEFLEKYNILDKY